jgi:hypothetical protein
VGEALHERIIAAAEDGAIRRAVEAWRRVAPTAAGVVSPRRPP